MPSPNQLAQDFIDALSSGDATRYERILRDDAGIRVWGTNGIIVHRPRERVVQYLMQEWSAWQDATIEMLSVVADDTRIAIEFRIQATEHQCYVEHTRAAFLTLQDSQIETIDLYCPAPTASARRKGWIAPAHLNGEQVLELFQAWQNSFDIRELIPFNYSGMGGLHEWLVTGGGAHPGSNSVFGVSWNADEANANIARVIEYHRARNIGFAWFVNPFDTPSDLCARLERHGLVLAGDQALMARVDLDNLDAIPTNPNVTVELVDGSDEEAIEAKLQIVGACFNWTKEQIDARRPNMIERIKNPIFKEREINFLARLNGTPVADARVILNAGVAYLGGASTLPAYRSQRIYSTMLRRRLENARACGYNVAMIHAEPMSRRVVSKYGFKEYGRAYLYAWMPVIDMKVIKSLVPDD